MSYRYFSHFKTIVIHKYYVFSYCLKAGIIWRGLVHDLSKFSPTEFLESSRYYTGTISPIIRCKNETGMSKAWLHHKGRNKHHYEYWQDNFDNGVEHLQMPYKYALELICDYLAAGKTYSNQEFSYYSEYLWWGEKRRVAAMHPHTKQFVEIMLKTMKDENSDDVLRKHRSLSLYNNIKGGN